MFITKKKHNKMVAELESDLQEALNKLADAEEKARFYRRGAENLDIELTSCIKQAKQAEKTAAALKARYPFDLGDTLYQIQLRSKSGRFTKSKPSRAHSTVIPVVVDEKNYFKLNAVYGLEVFDTEEKAATCLDGLCEE